MMRNREKPAIPRKAFLFCFSLQAGVVTYASLLFIVMVTSGLHNLTAEIRYSKSSYGVGIMYFYISLNIFSLTFLSTGAFLLNERVVFFGTVLVMIAACIWAIISILSLMYFMPAYEYLCIDERCPTTHWLFEEGFRTYTPDCEKSIRSDGLRELDDKDEPTPPNSNPEQTTSTIDAYDNFTRSSENKLPQEHSINTIDYSKGNYHRTEEANNSSLTTPAKNDASTVRSGKLQLGSTDSDYETTIMTFIYDVSRNPENSSMVSDEGSNETYNVSLSKTTESTTTTTTSTTTTSTTTTTNTTTVSPVKTSTESTSYDDFVWVTEDENVWILNPFGTITQTPAGKTVNSKIGVKGSVTTTKRKRGTKTPKLNSVTTKKRKRKTKVPKLNSAITKKRKTKAPKRNSATTKKRKTNATKRRKAYDAWRLLYDDAWITENDNVTVNQTSETSRFCATDSVITMTEASNSSSSNGSSSNSSSSKSSASYSLSSTLGKGVMEDTTTYDLSVTGTKSQSVNNSSYQNIGYNLTLNESHVDEFKNKYIQQLLNILRSWGGLYRTGVNTGVSNNTDQNMTELKIPIGVLKSFEARYKIPEKYCRFTYLNFLWTFTLFLLYAGFTIYCLWACFAFVKELKNKTEEENELE